MNRDTLTKEESLLMKGWSRFHGMLVAGSALLAAGGGRSDSTLRALAFEPLESRLALSAAGLIDVGTQPEGGLSEKIVYTHGGHGITANDNGSWGFQRPVLLDMVEDLGNVDQMTQLVDYLFRAGATVVPLRPVGHQPLEVVLDNDDPGVTFEGAWSDSSAPIYFGSPGDVPYRFATASATETAYARYRPTVAAADFYPVYAWTRSGSDRLSDQLYRVHHSGGITEVTVNHERVGNGLVYLGTYYFETGTEGYVDISNRSSDSGVVIADMIRFGNGVGDINRGNGVSGLNREDEAGLYWVEWHVDRSQGIPESEYRATSDDRDATVSLSPRYAEYMNREADGTLSDRVFVSFHSNAGGGNARGVLGLYNGNNDPNTATPNQFELANLLAREVNDDLVAQNGQFEHNWSNRSVVTLDRSDIEFGEINNLRIGGEFDATIIETAFHDNQLDAELMRDPRVREALARATYQGMVRYFNSVDGGATQVVMAPAAPDAVRAESTGAGSVTVSWEPPAANVYNGDAPAGYRIYASAGGYGFDGGRYVDGGATTAYTITGLDEGVAYYFKVVAVNDGGESPGSEVVAAMANGADREILIVNGFDRLDRSLAPFQSVPGGQAQRIWTRQANSFDYAVQVAEAIEAVAPGSVVDTASNEAVIAGLVDLADYDSVFWILGEESSSTDTFDATEQSLVSNFVAGGGNLFLSGSEIGWDLDNLNNGRDFYNNVLRADYVADDAGTYNVEGDAGSIFNGLDFSFDNGALFFDANFPDVIAANQGSVAALSYDGGSGGTAGIQYDGDDQNGKVVMFGFPFETITTAQNRADVMGRVLEFFQLDAAPSVSLEFILDNDEGPPTYAETGAWQTNVSSGFGGSAYQFIAAGSESTANWQFDAPFDGRAEVFVQYVASFNRANSVAYEVDTGLGVQSATANQQQNSLEWVSLGTFSVAAGTRQVTLDAEASTGGAIVIADAVRVVLTGRPPGRGDYNQDGFVSLPDYVAWRNQLGQTVETPGSGADGNFDGMVTQSDYDIWRANYGTAVVTEAVVTEAAGSSSSGGGPSQDVAEAPRLDESSSTATATALDIAIASFGAEPLARSDRANVQPRRSVAIATPTMKNELLLSIPSTRTTVQVTSPTAHRSSDSPEEESRSIDEDHGRFSLSEQFPGLDTKR
jgi:hypothetical protein